MSKFLSFIPVLSILIFSNCEKKDTVQTIDDITVTSTYYFKGDLNGIIFTLEEEKGNIAVVRSQTLPDDSIGHFTFSSFIGDTSKQKEAITVEFRNYYFGKDSIPENQFDGYFTVGEHSPY